MKSDKTKVECVSTAFIYTMEYLFSKLFEILKAIRNSLNYFDSIITPFRKACNNLSRTF